MSTLFVLYSAVKMNRMTKKALTNLVTQSQSWLTRLHVLFVSSLIQDLKERVGQFPDVSSGVYIYEVIPGTAASR